jgi:hypothetical protein
MFGKSEKVLFFGFFKKKKVLGKKNSEKRLKTFENEQLLEQSWNNKT